MRVQCQLLLRPSPPKACPNICYLSKYNFGNWKIFTTACQNMILVVTKINLSKIVYKKLPPMACPNPSFWMMHLKVCFGIFDHERTGPNKVSQDFSVGTYQILVTPFLLLSFDYWVQVLIIWFFDYLTIGSKTKYWPYVVAAKDLLLSPPPYLLHLPLSLPWKKNQFTLKIFYFPRENRIFLFIILE